MDNYICSIKTISPVHIGSGKEYNKSEYVLDEMKFKSKNKTFHKKVIKRIDISKFYSGLSDDKKDEFINILSQPNSNLTDFEPNIKKKFLKYYSFNNSTVDPRDINEHIKTLDEMYIPGSSIKGAIKTALFYSKLRQEDIYRIEKLFPDRGKVKLNTRAYNLFIDSFFSANRGNAAQNSIMKFLQISDTSTLKTPTVYDVLTIKATDNGRVIPHLRNNKIVYNYLETIRSNRKLKCNFGINYDEKVINNLKLNDKKNLIRLDTIKKAIYDFSKDLIDYELILDRKSVV